MSPSFIRGLMIFRKDNLKREYGMEDWRGRGVHMGKINLRTGSRVGDGIVGEVGNYCVIISY